MALGHIFNDACKILEEHAGKFAPVLRIAWPIPFPDSGLQVLPKSLGDYCGYLGPKFELPAPAVAIFAGSEMTVIADRSAHACGPDATRCFFLFQRANAAGYPPDAIKFIWGHVKQTDWMPPELDQPNALMNCSAMLTLSFSGMFSGRRSLVPPAQWNGGKPDPYLMNKAVQLAVMQSLVNSMRLIAFVKAAGKMYQPTSLPERYNPAAGAKIPRIPQRPVFEVVDFGRC